MANLMVLTGNRKALLAGLKTVSEAAPAVSEGGVPYLRLNRDKGVWVYGQTDTPVSKGSRWACAITTFAVGMISWKGGKVEAEAMASLGEPMIDPTTLPPVTSKVGWEEQVGVAFICVDSDNDSELGTCVIYKQNSKGGIEAVNRLRAAVMAAVEGDQPEVPIVVFDSSSYTHQEWGLVYKPVFAIDEWMTLDELAKEYGEDLKGVSLSARKLPGDREAPKVIEKAPEEPARARRQAAPKVIEAEVEVEDITPDEPKSRRRSTVVEDIRSAGAGADDDDTPPFDVTPEPASEPARRRRRQL